MKSNLQMSRFNHVVSYERNEKKLLMNFLSRSVDIIDAQSADTFLQNMESQRLDQEEKEYLLERGYAINFDSQESNIINRLYKNEIRNQTFICVLYLDKSGLKNLDLKDVLSKIIESREKEEAYIYSELTLLLEEKINYSPNIQEFKEFMERCGKFGLKTKLVISSKNLFHFQELLVGCIFNEITITCIASDFCSPIFFSTEVEEIIDHLLEQKRKVCINVKLSAKDTDVLSPLMNYFIRQGWPFMENFESHLEPKENASCFLGRMYSSDMELPKNILNTFKVSPQTEFFSVERWAGINILYELIWKSRLPVPSSHFCPASKGLMVFNGEGEFFPCLKIAEAGSGRHLDDDYLFADFMKSSAMTFSDCQGCKYALSCGGGCIYKAIFYNTGKVSCPPLRELLEISLKTYFNELQEKSDFIEDLMKDTKK